MKNNRTQNIKLGIFVIVSLLIFITGIYYLGKQQNLFQKVTKIYAYFDDIKGLKEGNTILFSGIHAGTVSDLSIVNDSTIKVEMLINDKVTPFIKKDSKVEITNEGVIGNKIINIYPGSANFENVKEGDFLPVKQTLNVEDVMKEAMEIVRKAKTLSEGLNQITAHVLNGDGMLGTILHNEQVKQDFIRSVNQMDSASRTINQLANKLNNGKGDMAKLINQDNITTGIDTLMQQFYSINNNLKDVSLELKNTTEQINSGNGLISKILYDTSLTKEVDSTLARANQSMEELGAAASAVEEAWIINLFSKDDKKKKQTK